MSPLLRKRRKPITTDSNHKLKPSFDRQGYVKHDPERGQTCWNRSSTVRRLMLFALSMIVPIICQVIVGRHHLYRLALSSKLRFDCRVIDEGWLYLAGVKDMATREIVALSAMQSIACRVIGGQWRVTCAPSFALPLSRWL